MPQTLHKLLTDLFEKSGLELTDARLTQLLAHADLKNIEVPKEVDEHVQQNLLSVNDAISNHPKIKTHYLTETMRNVEKGLNEAFESVALSTEKIEEINKERSPTRRIPLLA